MLILLIFAIKSIDNLNNPFIDIVKADTEGNSCHDGKLFVKDKETMPFL
jgi:hypothetical protein